MRVDVFVFFFSIFTFSSEERFTQMKGCLLRHHTEREERLGKIGHDGNMAAVLLHHQTQHLHQRVWAQRTFVCSAQVSLVPAVWLWSSQAGNTFDSALIKDVPQTAFLSLCSERSTWVSWTKTDTDMNPPPAPQWPTQDALAGLSLDFPTWCLLEMDCHVFYSLSTYTDLNMSEERNFMWLFI